MNEFTRNYLYEMFQGDELYHHGIQGMHWGVKNGPPYPLDKKVSASIKAGKNKKIRITAEEYRQARNKKHKKEDVTKRQHRTGGHLAEDSVIRMGFNDTSRNLVENTRQGGRWKSEDFQFV